MILKRLLPCTLTTTSLWPNWTRRLTTNQKIGGSSPSRDNYFFLRRTDTLEVLGPV